MKNRVFIVRVETVFNGTLEFDVITPSSPNEVSDATDAVENALRIVRDTTNISPLDILHVAAEMQTLN